MGFSDLFKNRLVVVLAIPLAITAITLLTDQLLKLAFARSDDDNDESKPTKVSKTVAGLLVHAVEPDSVLSSILDVVVTASHAKPASSPTTVLLPSADRATITIVEPVSTTSVASISTSNFPFGLANAILRQSLPVPRDPSLFSGLSAQRATESDILYQLKCLSIADTKSDSPSKAQPTSHSATTIIEKPSISSIYQHSFVAASPDSPSAPARVFYDPNCQYLPTPQDCNLGIQIYVSQPRPLAPAALPADIASQSPLPTGMPMASLSYAEFKALQAGQGQVPGDSVNGSVILGLALEPTCHEEEDLGQWFDHENRPQSEVGAYSRAYLDATEVAKSPPQTTEPPTHYMIANILGHILHITDPDGGVEDFVPSAGMEYTVALLAIVEEQLRNATPKSAARAVKLMQECVIELCADSKTGTASVEDCEATWAVISEEELVPRKTPSAKRSPKPATTSSPSPPISFGTPNPTPSSSSNPFSFVGQPFASSTPQPTPAASFSFATPTVRAAEPTFSPMFGQPSSGSASSSTRSDAMDVDEPSPFRFEAPPPAPPFSFGLPASTESFTFTPEPDTKRFEFAPFSFNTPPAPSPAFVGAAPSPFLASHAAPAINFSEFKFDFPSNSSCVFPGVVELS